jgi:FkbM family methyltransferase
MNDTQTFTEWLSQTNDSLNVVLDIGANYGDFYELVKHKNINQYHYFEPDIDNYKTCFSNLNLYDNTINHNCGIYYGKTESEVQGIGDNNSGGYMVSEINKEYKDDIWGERLVYYPEKVFKLKTLEEIISVPADLVKIDVEASEYNIIEFSPILKISNNLMIEWHNKDMDFVYEFIQKHLPNHKLIDVKGSLTFLKLK